ncbi:hypothetical protein RYJ27_11555 [Microbacterium limosum]|uniref:Uncharacterized protein n=1 Tax=Microbacterium limosum TaxID=3079935 RepID=A0AAU0MFJ6_9MICO|nr:hypothetical protein [Microbacterium sp. Y20]WOQ69320.1 hypothetical protein RYJ27_11555 [Microbacterium sp. Y20]
MSDTIRSRARGIPGGGVRPRADGAGDGRRARVPVAGAVEPVADLPRSPAAAAFEGRPEGMTGRWPTGRARQEPVDAIAIARAVRVRGRRRLVRLGLGMSGIVLVSAGLLALLLVGG